MGETRILPVLFAGAMLLGAMPATADSGFYFGTGFSYRLMNKQSFKEEKRYVQRKRIAHDIVIGYRRDNGDKFYGTEINIERFLRGKFFNINTEAECEAALNYSYFCTRRSTYRLRAIFGRKLNSAVEGYAALGIGIVKGFGAPVNNSVQMGYNTGFSAGLGLQIATGKRGMLRGEITYDNFNIPLKHIYGPNGTRLNPDYEATRIKVSYIFAF